MVLLSTALSLFCQSVLSISAIFVSFSMALGQLSEAGSKMESNFKLMSSLGAIVCITGRGKRQQKNKVTTPLRIFTVHKSTELEEK